VAGTRVKSPERRAGPVSRPSPRRQLRLRLPGLVRREPLLFLLAGFAALNYALYSVWEYNHFLSGYDLAAYDQAVWRYSNFELPTVTIGFLAPNEPPLNAWGDHFTPLDTTLAPLFWLWSDARMLLIAQAALVAAAVVPIYLFARDRVGRVGAYLLGASYLVFWGVSAAVAYDYHGLAFTPLLLALAILFADRRQWAGFFVSIAPLLLVKESMGVLVAFVGLWLLTGREVRRGLITVAIGVAWFALVIYVVIPAFAAGDTYTHWNYDDFGEDAPSSLKTILTNPTLPFTELVDSSDKTRVLALLFLPFLGLTFCSRLIVICIPLVIQQFYLTESPFWGTEFHYWLTIAPVLAMGAADGFRNLTRLLGLGQERSLAVAGAAVAGVILAVNLFLVAREKPVGSGYDIQVTGIPALTLTRPDFSLSPTALDRANQAAVDAIPDDASTTTAYQLLPHLSHRPDIYLLGWPTTPATDYVAFNASGFGWPDPETARSWIEEHRSLYREIYREDDWIIWKRR
jgi:uncharacterized membrane protein